MDRYEKNKIHGYAGCTKEDFDWLMGERERLRKALDEIDEEADNTYEESEAPELNDCINGMQQRARQALKEGEGG